MTGVTQCDQLRSLIPGASEAHYDELRNSYDGCKPDIASHLVAVSADEVACKHVDLTTRDDLPRGAFTKSSDKPFCTLFGSSGRNLKYFPFDMNKTSACLPSKLSSARRINDSQCDCFFGRSTLVGGMPRKRLPGLSTGLVLSRCQNELINHADDKKLTQQHPSVLAGAEKTPIYK
jgi:hypothetical protein